MDACRSLILTNRTGKAAAASPRATEIAFRGGDRKTPKVPKKSPKTPKKAKPGDERNVPFKQNILLNAIAQLSFQERVLIAGMLKKNL